MDAVFLLDGAARSGFLQFLMQSTGCTYICLWSYSSSLHQPNCLIGSDGWYNEQNSTQPGALVPFLEYRRLTFPLENNQGLVPGFAFRNYRPYIELGELELQSRASHQIQRQFYRTAVFMGCKSGEIELGSPNAVNLNMEMEMRTFFPEDFSRQSLVAVSEPTDPNNPSSSSSSLRSLSTDSPDSYLIFTVPNASRPQVPTGSETTPSLLQAKPASSSMYDPHQQAMQQALSEMRSNINLPSLESENAAMTRAILAVLTSPASSSSSTSQYHSQQSHNLPPSYQPNSKATAFKRYGSPLGTPTTTAARASLRAQSMLKRAILFYRRFKLVRSEQQPRSRAPTVHQLHHMLSERKRREKLNESFDALRSLLPPGTKKDRVSVLVSTREYLTSLKSQIMELNRQNQLLEAAQASATSSVDEANGSSNERLNIRIIPVPESTSEQRIIELRVSVGGEVSIVDILIQLLQFLKLDRNTSLMSTEANTRTAELGSINHVNLRFRIEGDDWDESTFQEAVRRILADLAQ
ncbi:hypothetical protein Goshw_015255 [Gossypium schwendimanii]|uniref:BHLH domain-containing protein n=1 Tax=Gossypium schwendimanii TaxID=34291 RepID=A0A7J9M456_GOSSC|nr:hypothetical protein [Gossypium schwendimanii]